MKKLLFFFAILLSIASGEALSGPICKQGCQSMPAEQLKSCLDLCDAPEEKAGAEDTSSNDQSTPPEEEETSSKQTEEK